MRMKLFYLAALVMICSGFCLGQTVPNGDFENWAGDSSPNNWYPTYGILVAKDWLLAHGGSYYARLTVNQNVTEGIMFFSDYVTGVTITPGQNYNLSAWITENDASCKARLEIMWYDGSDALLSTSVGSFTSDMTSWQQYQVVAAAPTGAAKVRVAARGFAVAPPWYGVGVFLLDDVTFSSTSSVSDWSIY